MRVDVGKWGNSAAIRLNKALLDLLHTAPGGVLEIQALDEGVLLKPVTESGNYSLEELLVTCTPANMKIDDMDKTWLGNPPVGKEIW